MRLFYPPTILLLIPLTWVAAQSPDSIAELPEIGVRVERGGLPLAGAASLTRLSGDSARQGRSSPTLDELFSFIPGVIARDRPDRSLDTRIVIRGAGARANFGVRGVRVLVDGVPATLPDGQTPLTTVDPELVERVEVGRGPLAALHGNGSQGVIALTTSARFPSGTHLQAATTHTLGRGSSNQAQVAIGAGNQSVGGMIAASLVDDDGIRDHSRAEQWRLRGSAEWRVSDNTSLVFRANWAEDPTLQAPGALTLSEFESDPRVASPTSLARNAGKSLSQRQLSATLRHSFRTSSLGVTGWALARELENPLAAPAPAPTAADEGTWVGLDRRVWGARSEFGAALDSRTLLAAGIDAQVMVDDRVNRRHKAGTASGPAFLDQREEVEELGAFLQVVSNPAPDWSIRGGVRNDRVQYDVVDHIDPAAGGSRTMSAWSVASSLAWHRNDLAVWVGLGTAFETPTSTELANSPEGSTGLNRDLQPSRTVSVELGTRKGSGAHSIEAVLFTARAIDAITPVAESGGRSFYDNVGTTHTMGAEATAAVKLSETLAAFGTATVLRSRFGDDALDAAGASIAGNLLPGVTPFTARVGLRVSHRGITVDVDQAWSAAVQADDNNSIEVPGWGVGITNAHLAARVPAFDDARLTLGVRNLFDRDHAVGVVVNGGFGRVVEPGSARRVFVGLDWRGRL
jgi:iron complex outermembrane receptor protein